MQEYFLACATDRIIVPPSAAFSLKGFSVQGAPPAALRAAAGAARCC